MATREELACEEIIGRYQFNGAGTGALPRLLEALGDPGRNLRGMTVTGTNGKGSTCAFAVSVLAAVGLRVGSMPSPHLQQVTERIRINGVPVSPAACHRAFAKVDDTLRRTGLAVNAGAVHAAAAAVQFAESDVDLAVMEANIGGRRTAVNCFDPGVKVITGVGLDHEHLLGNTLGEIARNKAGIVRDGDHVVLGELPEEAAKAVDDVLGNHTELTVWRIHQEVRYQPRLARDGRTVLDVATPHAAHRELPCPLRGAHQHHNLALAVAGIDSLAERGLVRGISEEALRVGLAATRWPGRLELLAPARLGSWTGRLLLDIAANHQGAVTVAPEILRESRAAKCTALVFGTLRYKNVATMLEPLPADWPVVLTRVGHPNEAAPDEMRTALATRRELYVRQETVDAVRHATELVGAGGLVAVLGTPLLIGRVRALFGLPPG
ncbi:bifunctional folylpolyglutamate synthase/dihydrofolate synthase [Streptomyces noursei]|uniref:bifunctional folylpolyglutamate synthase/dihydrofolate synthase n=1 Tax=Streptomyces noursei TaxID=1971 RepID=UPI0019992002|nr:Mur ligase family protein [Streptomyces noursei]MCZ1013422.1 Mur ligase family protein [Streptomyces noursei]GGX47782.1 dihydrofolate synthase [Streptomyces noursei]